MRYPLCLPSLSQLFLDKVFQGAEGLLPIENDPVKRKRKNEIESEAIIVSCI